MHWRCCIVMWHSGSQPMNNFTLIYSVLFWQNLLEVNCLWPIQISRKSSQCIKKNPNQTVIASFTNKKCKYMSSWLPILCGKQLITIITSWSRWVHCCIILILLREPHIVHDLWAIQKSLMQSSICQSNDIACVITQMGLLCTQVAALLRAHVSVRGSHKWGCCVHRLLLFFEPKFQSVDHTNGALVYTGCCSSSSPSFSQWITQMGHVVYTGWCSSSSPSFSPWTWISCAHVYLCSDLGWISQIHS
jgi:hypothetical protein